MTPRPELPASDPVSHAMRFLIPMATSLAFGVIFATAITLVLLPCATLILEDLRALPARLRASGGIAGLRARSPTTGVQVRSVDRDPRGW